MDPNAVQVLLIDDQPLVAAALRRLLAPAPDFQLRYCQDPADLDPARLQADILLIDLVMPRASGVEVVRRIRACPETARLPIVVLSCKEDPVSKAEAFSAGADDYLVKLPEGVELVARLRALLRRCAWQERSSVHAPAS